MSANSINLAGQGRFSTQRNKGTKEQRTFCFLCSFVLKTGLQTRSKRDKIEEYLLWCGQYITQSDEVLNFGRSLEGRCRIRPRDALHVASAMLGGARYFLSCERQVTEMKHARCYRRLAPPSRQAYFSAMNPRLFAEKLKKGEIE